MVVKLAESVLAHKMGSLKNRPQILASWVFALEMLAHKLERWGNTEAKTKVHRLERRENTGVKGEVHSSERQGNTGARAHKLEIWEI